MINMLNKQSLISLVACVSVVAMVSVAGAQTVRHDKMDSRAARRDISRLQKDRARAVHYKNWAKVAQDDRLIGSDRLWIRKDAHKVRHHS
jgi:hypothetical protein